VTLHRMSPRTVAAAVYLIAAALYAAYVLLSMLARLDAIPTLDSDWSAVPLAAFHLAIGVAIGVGLTWLAAWRATRRAA
jgi:flagellar biosynthesis protein FliR